MIDRVSDREFLLEWNQSRSDVLYFLKTKTCGKCSKGLKDLEDILENQDVGFTSDDFRVLEYTGGSAELSEILINIGVSSVPAIIHGKDQFHWETVEELLAFLRDLKEKKNV